MTYIASFPDRRLAEMAVNELNTGALPDAPRFEASEQPDAAGHFHLSADQSLQPGQVEYFRKFVRGLPFGSEARWMG